MLVNLLLLHGFALLAKHLENNQLPAIVPRCLPPGWKGGVELLPAFVLSIFLDNIAAAMIGGTIARRAFGGRVHIGYLAAIVAASNAGGAGNVVGDTTTMIWIAGIHPRDGLRSLYRCRCCGGAVRHTRVDMTRPGIVAFILVAAVMVNIVANTRYHALPDRFPFLGAAVWVATLLTVPLRAPDWKLLPIVFLGAVFLLSLMLCASMMPVEQLPTA